jgi:hypothetical protein
MERQLKFHMGYDKGSTGSETANGLLTGMNDLTAKENLICFQRIRPDRGMLSSKELRP